MKNRHLLFILLICTFFLLPEARAGEGSDKGAKFGFFDFKSAAVGGRMKLGDLTPHMYFNLDADLVLSRNLLVMLDFSLRYSFLENPGPVPYIGGGVGLAIGNDVTLPPHLIAGLNFHIDTLPTFVDVKIHLNKPSAVSLWFGVRF